MVIGVGRSCNDSCCWCWLQRATDDATTRATATGRGKTRRTTEGNKTSKEWNGSKLLGLLNSTARRVGPWPLAPPKPSAVPCGHMSFTHSLTPSFTRVSRPLTTTTNNNYESHFIPFRLPSSALRCPLPVRLPPALLMKMYVSISKQKQKQ